VLTGRGEELPVSQRRLDRGRRVVEQEQSEEVEAVQEEVCAVVRKNKKEG